MFMEPGRAHETIGNRDCCALVCFCVQFNACTLARTRAPFAPFRGAERGHKLLWARSHVHWFFFATLRHVARARCIVFALIDIQCQPPRIASIALAKAIVCTDIAPQTATATATPTAARECARVFFALKLVPCWCMSVGEVLRASIVCLLALCGSLETRARASEAHTESCCS